MKIAIFTLGTRGDVQPYVAIGVEAIKRGHEVIICTGESFQTFIEEHGIQFAKADLDLMALLQTKEGQDVFNNGMKRIVKARNYAQQHVNPAYRKTIEQFYNCVKDADIILYHPKALGTPDIAQHLNVPCMMVSPVPFIYPIEEFPNLVVSPTRNFGSFFNRLSYMASKYAEASNISEINDFRENVLHVPKRKSGIYTYEMNGKHIPIVYPVSPALFSDVRSWGERVYLPGFVFLENETTHLDDKIKGFLENGSEPIVISFSSMPLKDPNKFKDVLLEALKKTNDRAVVLTGVSGIEFENNERVFAISFAPHDVLFPLAKGILHHGGAGTTASALKSGKPQVIMPFSVDQPFWANRLYQLGYALQPLSEKTLTVDKLTQSFIKMGDEVSVQKAIDIKKKLDNENGNANMIDYIEKIYNEYKRR